MATPHFYLKDKSATKPTLIILYYYLNSKRFAYSTGERVMPKLWSVKREQVVDRHPESERINSKLGKLKLGIKECHDQILKEKGYATKTDLKHKLDIHSGKIKGSDTLFGFIDALIEERHNSSEFATSTIRGYEQARTKLHEFAASLGKEELDFTDVDYSLINSFKDYLIRYDHSSSYINKIISRFRAFLNEATRRKINTNKDYQLASVTLREDESSEIYLNKTELEKLYFFDFSDAPRIERVRDLFIVGALTGLRYTDFVRLSSEHIREIDGFPIIDLVTHKTKDQVLIPLHPYVDAILKKYGGKVPDISGQRMNSYLKEMGELTGFLNQKVTKSITKGGQKQVEKVEKYKLIKTHTARRSFATNAFLAGWPSLSIMKITGHSTESSFMRYIRVTKEQNAVHIAQTQFFQMAPEGAKVHEALKLINDNAGNLELTTEELELLEKIKEKVKRLLPANHLRIAK